MSKFNLVRLMWYRNKVKWKYRTVSGTPPLTYKAKSDGVLKNYRIYGNTVNGESVGDKTENLIQGVITGVNISSNGKISGLSDYNVVYAPVVAEESYTISNNNGVNVYAFYAEVPTTETPSSYNGSRQVFNSDSVTFTAPITGYAAVRTASTAQDIMINFGSEALPYEPYGYRVPVTVTNGTDTETKNIYLPEQIKMVGDEAEYIDYAEQKQHFANGTSVDVSLPALPTFEGTNILSVGTTVQPSGVELRGRIMEVDSGGD